MYKVYLIRSEGGNYKIGYTKRDPLQRLRELSTGNSEYLDIVDIFESKWGTKIEAKLHRKYESDRKRGEWFVLSDENVESFQEDCQEMHNLFEYLSEENYWFQKENERFI